MGFFDFLRGRRTTAIDGETSFVVKDRVRAAQLRPPAGPVWDAPPQPPCERCGRALAEVVITTGGPDGDPEIWEAAPVAVDGWACAACGVVRYPRPATPERITAYGQRGGDAARAGKWLDADWWFTRITWTWPGWAAGYVDLASALRGRATGGDVDPERRRRLLRRAEDAYEAAIAACTTDVDRNTGAVAAAAYIGQAELAIEQRVPDRARRAVDACLALDPRDPTQRARAEEIRGYLDEERWLFHDAAAVVEPYLRLMDRSEAAIETGDVRSRVAAAVEVLEQYHQRRPEHWQSIWAAAKGREALGEDRRALDLWRQAWAAHPAQRDIVRELGLLLLRCELNEEARDLNRDATARFPRDATLWCNRAVTELLTGDLAQAEGCLATSREIDPDNPVTRIVESRLRAYAGGAPLPKTLSDLERG